MLPKRFFSPVNILTALMMFVLLFPKLSLIQGLSGFPTPIRIEDLLIAIFVLYSVYLTISQNEYREKFLKIVKLPVTRLIFMWLGVATLSTVYNGFKTYEWGGLFFIFRFIEYTVFFFLSALFVSSWERVKKIFVYISLSSIPLSLWAVLQLMGILGGFGGGFYGYTYIFGTDRAFASFSGPYELAGFLIIIIPLTFAMWVIESRGWLKKALLVSLLLSIVALGMSGSRFPIIASAFSIPFFLFVQRDKSFSLKVIAVTLLIIIVPPMVSKSLVERYGHISQGVGNAVELATLVPSPTVTPLPTMTPTPRPTKTPSPVAQISITKSSNAGGSPVKPTIPEATSKPPETNVPTTSVTTVVVSGVDETITEDMKNKPAVTNTFISDAIDAIAEKDASLYWRLKETWPRAFEAVSQNVWLGTGMGSLGIGLDSEFVTLFGETGILGIIAYVVLMMVIGYQIIIRVRKSTDERQKLIITTAGIILIALLVNGIFVDIFRASKVAMLLWFILGLIFSNNIIDKKKD